MSTYKRNPGIDLLRMVCMLGVVIQHLLGHGWMIPLLHVGTWKYDLAVALRSLSIVSISGFALITGYIGVKGRFKYGSLVLQWTKVFLYSVALTVLCSVFAPGTVSGKEWRSALFPTLSRQYWYFTAYVGCMMLAPMIRMAMRRMSMKQATVCLIPAILVFSPLNNLMGIDAFDAHAGQGVLWLAVLYVIGAYLGRFQPHAHVPKAALWALAAASAVLLVGVQPAAQRLGIDCLNVGPQNNSLTTLLAAICMLMAFSRLEIRRGEKLIGALGAASFGVYLIHDHPQIRKHTISKYAYQLTELDPVQMIMGTVLTAVLIYLICALIDTFRQKIYDALRIRQRLDALESRLIGDLWAD